MTTPQLSTRTTERLINAHAIREEDGFEALLAIVEALRNEGWPLKSIAEPLGVSREIVRVWAKRAATMDLPTVTVESLPRIVPQSTIDAEQAAARRVNRARREAEALARNVPRLLELQADAESLRGPSAFSPRQAAASAEYTRLIDQTLRAGVRGRVLAEALGVQQITLHARMRRSGLRQTAPSEKIPAWAKTKDWANVLHDAKPAGRT